MMQLPQQLLHVYSALQHETDQHPKNKKMCMGKTRLIIWPTNQKQMVMSWAWHLPRLPLPAQHYGQSVADDQHHASSSGERADLQNPN